jgi:hypothetical protein
MSSESESQSQSQSQSQTTEVVDKYDHNEDICTMRALGISMIMARGWRHNMKSNYKFDTFIHTKCRFCADIIEKLFDEDKTVLLSCANFIKDVPKERLRKFIKKHKWIDVESSAKCSYTPYADDDELSELFIKYGGYNPYESRITDERIAELLEFPPNWHDWISCDSDNNRWNCREFNTNIAMHYLRRMTPEMGAYLYKSVDTFITSNNEDDKYIGELVKIIPYAYIIYTLDIEYEWLYSNRESLMKAYFKCDLDDGICSLELFDQIFSYSDERYYINYIKMSLNKLMGWLLKCRGQYIKFRNDLRQLILTKHPRYTFVACSYDKYRIVTHYVENDDPSSENFFICDFKNNYVYTRSPEVSPIVDYAGNKRYDVAPEDIFKRNNGRCEIKYPTAAEIESAMTNMPLKDNPLKPRFGDLYRAIYGDGEFDRANLLEFYRYFIVNPYALPSGVFGKSDHMQNKAVTDILYECWLLRLELSTFIDPKTLDAFIIRHGRESAAVRAE